MPVIAETHCHSLASGHAYSTIYENVQAAARAGLRFLCATDHGPAMPGAGHPFFFDNIGNAVPDQLEGVVVLKGAEVNIMDYQGGLDLDAKLLEKLDWVIASYHPVCIRSASTEEHTQGWLAVAENPLVDVIGHCGDGRYTFDLDRVIPAFAQLWRSTPIRSPVGPDPPRIAAKLRWPASGIGYRLSVVQTPTFLTRWGRWIRRCPFCGRLIFQRS